MVMENNFVKSPGTKGCRGLTCNRIVRTVDMVMEFGTVKTPGMQRSRGLTRSWIFRTVDMVMEFGTVKSAGMQRRRGLTYNRIVQTEEMTGLERPAHGYQDSKAMIAERKSVCRMVIHL